MDAYLMSYLPNLNSVPSVTNTTVALLTGGAAFTGTGERHDRAGCYRV